jgi:hypothetical protein
MDRLASRAGKDCRFATATVSARNEAQARKLAAAQCPIGLNWEDREIFACGSVRVFGEIPPGGKAFYQLSDD